MLALGRRGLTLIELVVGILITSIAVAGGFAAFSALIDHRGRVEAATDGVVRATTVRTELATWLASAKLSPEKLEPTFRGLDGSRDRHPDDILEFETTAPILDAAVTRVRLSIDRDPETPESGLVAELSLPDGSHTERVVLDPDAEGFDVHFLGRVSGGRIWLDSWVSSTLLPVGLQLKIAGRAEVPTDDLLALPITVAIGGGA